ncbi:MAG: glutaredoxin family protein [Caldisericia bacterium]|nr:glutaredoxin family protein [Caldisericia bacterium]
MDPDLFLNEVDGKECGQIILYALSTCGWCQKVRNLLEQKGARYRYLYIDQLPDLANLAISQEIEKWNPDLSFPTLVLNDSSCIIGYNEKAILDWFDSNMDKKEQF